MSTPDLRRSSLRARVTELTPARVLLARAGTSYTTADLLRLRADHAAARDAVTAPAPLTDPALSPLVDELGLFEVSTRATTRTEHLRRPDLGRQLDAASREVILCAGLRRSDVQLVVGDGLSAAAVLAQAPGLLRGLVTGAAERGWTTGRPFLVHHCRVGVLNDVGDLLEPDVVVLLIGERPGLATSTSLSAYLAWRPRSGHTDAQRNVLANIHSEGIPVPEAVERVMTLVTRLRQRRASGVGVPEAAPLVSLGGDRRRSSSVEAALQVRPPGPEEAPPGPPP